VSWKGGTPKLVRPRARKSARGKPAWNGRCFGLFVRVFRWEVPALGLLAIAASSACAPIEIQYKPSPTMREEVYGLSLDRHPLAPSQVEVFDRESAPWDYLVIGSLQEVHRDSIPGGRPARRLVLREVAAEQGCDGLMMNGNVSVFDGRYTYRSPRRRSSDASRRGGRWVPLFDLKGEGADCVVRRGAPEAAKLDAEKDAEWWSFVPTDYSFLQSGHY